MGNEQQAGVIQAAYRILKSNQKDEGSVFELWGMGIESENSLSDEFSSGWRDRLSNGQSPRSVISNKERVKLLRDAHGYMPEPITSFTIKDQKQLGEFIRHYSTNRIHLE